MKQEFKTTMKEEQFLLEKAVESNRIPVLLCKTSTYQIHWCPDKSAVPCIKTTTVSLTKYYLNITEKALDFKKVRMCLFQRTHILILASAIKNHINKIDKVHHFQMYCIKQFSMENQSNPSSQSQIVQSPVNQWKCKANIPALPIDEIDDRLKSISIDGNRYQLIDWYW